jgi:hypothetical protein
MSQNNNMHRQFAKPRRAFDQPVSDSPSHPAFIQPPLTNFTNLKLPLDVIVPGVDEGILKDKEMVFHTVGDTGGINGTDVQEWLAKLMQGQIDESRKAASPVPRFFYHLGDVVYYNGLSLHYREQFYEPYQDYDAPILAIPGNHDGDTRVRPKDEPDHEPTLFGFMENFCAPQAQFLFKHRQTMTQPYVYWTLDTPLAVIIGLYSNVDGNLDAPGTFEQQSWLTGQLQAAKDRTVIVAVHHPPYSLDSHHGGYPDIGAALDRAFGASGKVADLVLSGHVHSYQRFTRDWKGQCEVPYVVAGAGGYAHRATAMHTIAKDPHTKQPLETPFKTARKDVTLAAYNDTQPGFLRMSVNEESISGEYYTIGFDGTAQGVSDSFVVDLKKHEVSEQRVASPRVVGGDGHSRKGGKGSRREVGATS